MSIQGYFLVLILVLVMAGMVALVIAQSDKGGHQGKGLASMRWHLVVIVNGWHGLWLVALTSLVHIIINLYNTRLAKTR